MLAPEHVSVPTWNSPRSVPVTATAPSTSGAFPPLETVTVCAALVVPTPTSPNASVVGLIRMMGAIPVPLSAMLWGLVAALDVKAIVAARAPIIDGVKETPTVQVPAAGMVAPEQVLADRA
jgi:hypothetical protein